MAEVLKETDSFDRHSVSLDLMHKVNTDLECLCESIADIKSGSKLMGEIIDWIKENGD